MKNLSRVALAGVFALGLASAAQAQSAQVPKLGNPYPANPIATDGSPLPLSDSNLANRGVNGGLFTGRSAFVSPVGGLVGSGVDAAGAVVGTGVGVAGGAVDTGLGAAGTAVDGGVGIATGIVR